MYHSTSIHLGNNSIVYNLKHYEPSIALMELRFLDRMNDEAWNKFAQYQINRLESLYEDINKEDIDRVNTRFYN